MFTQREVRAQLLAVGSRIARQRRKRGISLEGLAVRSGLSQGNLSDIENGKRDPRLSTLVLISGALGLTVSELLNRIEQEQP